MVRGGVSVIVGVKVMVGVEGSSGVEVNARLGVDLGRAGAAVAPCAASLHARIARTQTKYPRCCIFI